MNSSWFQSIDTYCERLDASFWAEPVNAVSNAFFLLAAAHAFWLWRQKERADWASLWLIVVTAIVGIGSFLFHTFANHWSLLADVLPIGVFIYSYFLLAMRRYLRLGILVGVAITIAFVAFNMSFTQLWFLVFPGVSLNSSVNYLPALMAMLAVGCLCWVSKAGRAGRALLWAGGVFVVSLFFRTIDNMICSALPLGTHMLWHMLNALVLWILMNAAIRHAPEKRLLHVQG